MNLKFYESSIKESDNKKYHNNFTFGFSINEANFLQINEYDFMVYSNSG